MTENAARDDRQIFTVPAGGIVLEEGVLNEDMFKILKGNAELYISYGTENEVLISILRQGDCFGEFGLLLKKPSLYTVIAYSDLVLYRVTPERIGAYSPASASSFSALTSRTHRAKRRAAVFKSARDG